MPSSEPTQRVLEWKGSQEDTQARLLPPYGADEAVSFLSAVCLPILGGTDAHPEILGLVFCFRYFAKVSLFNSDHSALLPVAMENASFPLLLH